MSNYPPGVTGNEREFYPNTTAICHECGCEIDIERETYGQSIDGERYCCGDCLEECAILSTFFVDFPGRWVADATFECEDITTRHANEIEAMKRAEELADTAWSVKSYVEKN